jgi:hypothetical protein
MNNEDIQYRAFPAVMLDDNRLLSSVRFFFVVHRELREDIGRPCCCSRSEFKFTMRVACDLAIVLGVLLLNLCIQFLSIDNTPWLSVKLKPLLTRFYWRPMFAGNTRWGWGSGPNLF